MTKPQVRMTKSVLSGPSSFCHSAFVIPWSLVGHWWVIGHWSLRSLEMSEQWDYKKAGLDLSKYEETIAGIQPLLARTHDRTRVIPPPFPPRKGGKGVGGFASLFDLNPDGRYTNPVLVTCTDGVGSKLKVASLAGKFDTVGIDLVAMSVNDLICTGGEPLVFLDYLAMPKDDPELSKLLLQGISDGCVESGCSLVGGETAILPDFYSPGDFDLAGFAA